MSSRFSTQIMKLKKLTFGAKCSLLFSMIELSVKYIRICADFFSTIYCHGDNNNTDIQRTVCLPGTI